MNQQDYKINFYHESYQYAEPIFLQATLEEAQEIARKKLVEDSNNSNQKGTFWSTFTLRGESLNIFESRVRIIKNN